MSKSKTYSPQKSLRISVLCVCHFQGRHVVPCTSLLVWSGSVSGGWRSRKTLRLSFGDEPCLTICFFRKGSLIVFGPVIMLSGDPPEPAAGLRERGAEGEGGRRCSLEARYFFFATNGVCFVVLTRRFSRVPACVLTHLRTQARVRAPVWLPPRRSASRCFAFPVTLLSRTNRSRPFDLFFFWSSRLFLFSLSSR